MTSIISSSTLGLFGSSLSALGQAGANGNPLLGRAGQSDRVYVNSVTGNLVVQASDDYLTSVGLDTALVRTYNSQGQFTDDNGDNWRLGIHERVFGLTGTVNTAGSTITKTFGDGADIVYSYNTTLALYVSTAGDGANDTLAFNAGTSQWTWTDGSARNTETYNSAGQIIAARDGDGNTTAFTYTGALLTSVVDASGQTTFLDYTGTNLAQIRVVSQGLTQTLTRYAYDASNRLTQVTVDLTPADNAIADANTYTTTYTYDGTSKRVASITHKDGSTVGFLYDAQGRVASYTDGAGKVTTLSYTSGTATTATANGAVLSTTDTQTTTNTANLNSAALSTTDTQTTTNTANLNTAALTSQGTTQTANLITSALTTPGPWGTASLRESLTTASATSPQITFDQNGNGLAVWALGTDLFYSLYTKSSDSWSAAATLDGTLTGSPTKPNLSMSANGNALVTWVQNNNVYARRFIAGVWDGATTIPNLENLTGAAVNPVGAINDNGRAVVAFIQTNGTPNNLYTNVYNGTAWATAATAVDDIGTANSNSITNTTVPSVAIDSLNNATVLWLQKTGTQTSDSLYFSRFTGTWSTPNSTTLENTTTAVTAAKIAFDGSGNGIAVWVQGTSLLAKRYTVSNNTWSASTTLSTATPTAPSLAMSANGNAIVAWTQSNNVVARRFAGGAWVGTAAETVETLTTAARNASAAINNAGQAAVAFVQPTSGTTNSVYVNTFNGTAWQTATAVDDVGTANANSVATTMTPSVAIDALGNVNTVWLQKTGAETTDSVYSNRFTTTPGAPFYAVQTGDTWASIAQTLYGTVDAASPLSAALGNPPLTPGNHLSNLPATLSVVAQSLFYLIPAGATWASVATELYGTANVATQLQTALGNPPLTAGNHLTNLPASLTYTTTTTVTVPPYYPIPAGATWASIATALYGTANVATQLQTALGNPPLTAGNHLTNLPASLTFTTTTTVTVPAYYVVRTGDTWAVITQAIYATADPNAVAALQTALGFTSTSPVPAVGTHLTVPQSLTYSTSTGSGGQADITDPLGFTTSYITDTQGRLTQVLSPTVNGVRLSTSYAYDVNSNVTQVIDGNGNTTVMQYDASNNLLLQRDALGNTVAYAYSSANQLILQTSYLTPDPDGAGAAQPSNPVTTRLAYDAENHLRFTITPEGRVTEYRYDAAGNRTAMIGYTAGLYPAGGTAVTEAQLTAWIATQDLTKTERTDYTFDFRGNVSSATTYASVATTGLGVADGTQSTTNFVYDQRGQLLQSVDPRGVATTTNATDYITNYVYDGLGRLLSTSQWLNATETRTTLTAYDDANHKVVTTLANGLATTRIYDARGLLLSIAQTQGATPLGTTTYQYDADGRLRTTIDPNGNKNYALYDEAGRIIAGIDTTGALTETVYSDNSLPVKQIGYANLLSAAQLASLTDAGGNPANVTVASVRPVADSANDRVTRTIYDAAGRPVMSISTTDTDATQGFVTQTFYDGAGRITDVIGYANAISLATLTATTTPAQVGALITTNTADRHLRRFYDNDGVLVAELKEEGYLCEYSYNAAGELTHTLHHATAVGVALRAAGTLAQLQTDAAANANDQHEYVFYNARGQVIATLDAENYLTEHAYDGAGNQTQTTRYYTRGNAYTGTQTIAQLRPAANANDAVTISAFDGDNRLISVTANPNGTVTQYSYDTLGNLLRTDRALNTTDLRTNQARYDAQGRVLQELTGEGSVALAALVSPTQAQIDAVWSQYALTYTYDIGGRRTSATDQNGNKTLFYYDADDRLTHTVNALGEVTEVRYNASGQATDSIRYGTRISTTGLVGGVITAALTSALTAIANSTLDSRSQVSYTLRGLVKAALDELSNSTASTYNAFGDLATRTDPIAAGASLTTAFSYDRRGLLTQTGSDAAGINRITSGQYDTFGRVIQSTDGLGVLRTYTYDKLGRQVTATLDPTGLNLSTSATYDAFSRTLTQTDALNNVTTTVYNDAARSFTVTTQEGVSVTTTANRHGQTVTLLDGRGITTSYNYDKNGNLKSTQLDPTGLNLTSSANYDRAGRLIESFDAKGVKTTLGYDAANRVLTRTFDPTGLNLVTTYSYDAKGQTVSVQDPKGIVTQSSYDLKGEVLQIAVDPAGLNLRTSFAYDAQGRTLTTTTGVGSATPRTVQYVYDKLGRRVEEHVDPSGLNLVTLYAYDKNDNVVTATDPRGNVTRFYYDSANRRTHILDALNGLVKTFYDADGQVVKSIAYANALAGLPANPNLAQIEAAIPAATDATRDVIVQNVYDRDGRLVFSFNALGEVTQNVFDADGNVTKSIAYATRINPATAPSVAAVTAAIVANAALDHSTSLVYDNANRVVFSFNALGEVAKNDYDANDNIVKSTRYANRIAPATAATIAAVTAALVPNAAADLVVNNVYDNAGRQVFSFNALGEVSKNDYDAAGNLVKTTNYANRIAPATTATVAAVSAALVANTASDQSASLVYDNANRVVFSFNALGEVTKNDYDAASNVVKTTRYANRIAPTTAATVAAVSAALVPNGASDLAVSNVYDADKRLVFSFNALGAVSKSDFDANGNVIAITQYATAISLAGLGSTITAADIQSRLSADPTRDFVKRYAFDAAGREIFCVDSLQGLDEFQYDGLGQLVRETRYANGLSTGVAVTVSAIQAALPGLANAGADETTRTVYDAAGRVVYGVDALNFVTQSTYDANGNVISSKQYAIAVTLPATLNATTLAAALVTSSADRTTRTVYDAANHAIYTIDAAGFVEQSSYDKAGNVIETVSYANIPTIGQTAPTVAQVASALSTVLNVALDQHTTFAYDAANHLTQVTDALGGLRRYTYDGAGNQLTCIDEKNNTWTYTYDAAGRVLTEVTPPVAVTRPFVFTQDFSVDASGYTGDGISSGLMSVSGGRLVATAQNVPAAAAAWRGLQGIHVFTTAQATTFHSEVTTTTSAGQQLIIGAENNGIASASPNPTDTYRRMAAYFSGGTVYAHAYDQNNAWISVALGTVSDNTTYNVDVVVDANGATLYVYAAGQDRASGFSYSIANTTWGNAHSTMWTLGNPGQATNTVYIDNLTETTAITTTESVTTAMTYDALGNVKTRTEASGTADARTTTYVYDALGRQIQTITPATSVYNATTDLAANYAGRNETSVTPASTTYYDISGNAIASKDVKGNVSYKVYDQLGRVAYEIDAERFVTKYAYDAFGNQITLTRYASALSDAALTAATLTTFSAREAAATTTAIQGFTLANLATLTATLTSSADRTLTEVYDRRNQQIETRAPAVVAFDSSANTETMTPWAQDFSVDASGLSALAAPYFSVSGGKLVTTTQNVATAQVWPGLFGSRLYPTTQATTFHGEVTTTTAAGRNLWFGAMNSTGTRWLKAYFNGGTLMAEVLSSTSQVQVALGAINDNTTYNVDVVVTGAGATLYVYTGTNRASGFAYTVADTSWANAQLVINSTGTSTMTPNTTFVDNVSEIPANESFTASPTVDTTYDAFGEAVKVSALKNPLTNARVDNYQYYNAIGQKTAQIDPLGYLTTYQYDANGNLTESHEYATALTPGSWTATSYPTPPSVATTYEAETLTGVGGGFPSGNVWAQMGAGYVAANHTFTAGVNTISITAYGQLAGGAWPHMVVSVGGVVIGDTMVASASPGVYRFSFNAAAGAQEVRIAFDNDFFDGVNDRNLFIDKFTVAAGDGNDRITRSTYDRLNRKLTDTKVGVLYTSAAYGTSATLTPVLGDLTTSYAYDALGNVTTVTDATGAQTFTYYDAQGRITAVAAPARAGSGGGTIIPLAVLQRDIFGNVVKQTSFVNGASAASAAGFTAGVADATNDQSIYNQYDNYGRTVRSIDAKGVSVFSSYDAMGNVMKQWRALTDPDGRVSQTIALFGYDRLSHQVLVGNVLAGTTPTVVLHQTHYDAFGEIDKKGINDGWQEYYDYDAAGRLWQSNQGDGVNQVMFYDLQGNATSQSKTTARLAASPTTAAVAGGAQRTDVIYDNDGRTIQQIQPTFTTNGATITPVVSQSFDRWGNVLSVTDPRNAGFVTNYRYDSLNHQIEQKAPSVSTAAVQSTANSVNVFGWTGEYWASDEIGTDESGNPIYGDPYFHGGNSVALGWPSIASLGTGDVTVTVFYAGLDGSVLDGGGNPSATDASITQTFASAASLTGANLNWYSDNSGHVTSLSYVKRVVVTKVVGTSSVTAFDSFNITSSAMRPTTTNFYDARGLALGTIDPDGNLAAKRYDAGGNLISEYHADGGIVRHVFDAFGREIARSTPASSTTGFGLTVTFYDNKDLTGPSVTRSDQRVDYFWGGGSPDPSIGADTFSARWEGQVEPQYSEAYTFWVMGDDGYRLWVNNQLVIDRWFDQSGGVYFSSAPIALTAGQRYAIRLEYYENGGTAKVQLAWQSASTPFGDVDRLFPTPAAPAPDSTTTYTYDRGNHLLTEQLPIAAERNTYAYDQAGNRISATNGAGETTRYFYDTLGNLVTTRNPMGGTNPNTIDRTLVQYDAFGHKTLERNAAGDVSTWSYDYFGRLVSHTDLGGHVYDYRYNGLGQLIGQTSHASAGTTVPGLSATYYDNKDFTGASVKRTDPTVNFDWGGGSPDPSIGPDTFSAVWEGQVQAEFSEVYTFYVRGDDGYRLWVNNQLVIDRWFDQSPTEGQGSIALAAGQRYAIRLEYYENGGGAVAQLSWSSPSIAAQLQAGGDFSSKQIIPPGSLFAPASAMPIGQNLSYSYYENGRLKEIVDNALQTDSLYEYDAAGDVTRNRFASLATGVVSQDTRSAYDAMGRLIDVNDVSQTNGLTTTYFDNINLTGASVTRTSSTVNFDWGTGSPDPSIFPDTFSARWEGQVAPQFSELYTFYVRGDDGYRLWVNNQLVIDRWINQSSTEVSGSIALVGGQRYAIRLEYFENGTFASVQLSWSSASTPKQVIPSERLFNGQLTTTHVQYSYDAAGNRLRTLAQSGAGTLQDNWYAYDSMNRVTLSQGFGLLYGGQLAIAPGQGTRMTYDSAGNLRSTTTNADSTSYNYDAENRLIGTFTSSGGLVSTSTSRTYDGAGRLTKLSSYKPNWGQGAPIGTASVKTYNADGYLITQTDSTNGIRQNNIQYTLDGAGNILQYTLDNWNSGGAFQYTFSYADTYQKFDNYKLASVVGSVVANSTGTTLNPGNTTIIFDVNGNQTTSTDSGNPNNNATFVTTPLGQIVKKLGTVSGKVQTYLYVGANPVGNTGDLSPVNFDQNYTPTSDQFPTATSGRYVVNSGDTLRSIAFVNYGDASLWYMVADGNGLMSDADLRVGQALIIPAYASANLHNNAGTFKVYNAAEITGPTTPTPTSLQSVSQSRGCGVLGIILVAIVAVVATVFTAGLAATLFAAEGAASAGIIGAGVAALSGESGLLGVAAAAIGGAVGSAASQLVGIGLGIQNKFSWAGVAAGALGAGVTSGIGALAVEAGVMGQGAAGLLGLPKNSIEAGVINGIVNNAANQGIRILVGQQKRFDWASVAVAGISGGVSGALAKTQLGQTLGFGDPQAAGSFDPAKVLGQTAFGIARGALTQVLGNHGKVNWAYVAADAFGNALANSIVSALRNPQPQSPAAGASQLGSPAQSPVKTVQTPPDPIAPWFTSAQYATAAPFGASYQPPEYLESRSLFSQPLSLPDFDQNGEFSSIPERALGDYLTQSTTGLGAGAGRIPAALASKSIAEQIDAAMPQEGFWAWPAAITVATGTVAYSIPKSLVDLAYFNYQLTSPALALTNPDATLAAWSKVGNFISGAYTAASTFAGATAYNYLDDLGLDPSANPFKASHDKFGNWANSVSTAASDWWANASTYQRVKVGTEALESIAMLYPLGWGTRGARAGEAIELLTSAREGEILAPIPKLLEGAKPMAPVVNLRPGEYWEVGATAPRATPAIGDEASGMEIYAESARRIEAATEGAARREALRDKWGFDPLPDTPRSDVGAAPVFSPLPAIDSDGLRRIYTNAATLPPQIYRGEIFYNSAGEIDTHATLQAVTNHVVADLAVNPGKAGYAMSNGSYIELAMGGSPAAANYGKAVERLGAFYIVDTPELARAYSYQSRYHRETPDFLGFEGSNVKMLDVTTAAEAAGSKLTKWYGPYTQYVIHPGLPKGMVFPY